MERLAAQLPPGFAYEWTGSRARKRLSGSTAMILFAFSLLSVFLCLAALYESWSIPLSVILIVPLGVVGVVAGISLRGLENDVYFKVGLITIIGLSAKNAVLIIEFAKDLHAQGKSVVDAVLEAAHLRFRPIVMTSMAFILGVLPLVLATGAGSASQRAIGTGVISGMLSATTLAVFFVPVFFVLVRRTGRRSQPQQRQQQLQRRPDAGQFRARPLRPREEPRRGCCRAGAGQRRGPPGGAAEPGRGRGRHRAGAARRRGLDRTH
jgi:multidrug efflux pump